MYYILIKITLIAVLAFPVPLVSWYLAIDFLFESFHLLWVTPILLLLCLTAPYTGYLMIDREVTQKRHMVVLAAYATTLTALIVFVTIFKKPLERLFEALLF